MLAPTVAPKKTQPTRETGAHRLFRSFRNACTISPSLERAAMSATNSRPPQTPSDEESAQAREAGRQLARLLPEGERPLRLAHGRRRARVDLDSIGRRPAVSGRPDPTGSRPGSRDRSGEGGTDYPGSR